MTCPHCSSLKIANRSRLIAHGYKTFHCNAGQQTKKLETSFDYP